HALVDRPVLDLAHEVRRQVDVELRLRCHASNIAHGARGGLARPGWPPASDPGQPPRRRRARPVACGLMQTAGASVSGDYEGFIGWVLPIIATLGEIGVGLAVLIENFFPPIPSEAILPGAGFLAYDGRMSFWWALVAATLGSVVGAWVWYGLGAAL